MFIFHMDNILIYTGLTILILGSLFGIYTAVKACREQDTSPWHILWVNPLERRPVSKAIKRRIITWGIIMAAGFIITGAGIAIGLN